MICERCYKDKHVKEFDSQFDKYCSTCYSEMKRIYLKYSQDTYNKTKKFINLIRDAK